MTSRTKKPNISPIPETSDLKTTTELYREYDEYLRNEAKKNNKRVINKTTKIKENIVDSYAAKLKMINEQDVTDPNEIELKIKDLKELEKQIKEEIVLQEKKKREYVDDIFENGELLVAEIEEKRKNELTKKEKSIFRKLIDFLFGL